jgi:hypothetical protein
MVGYFRKDYRWMIRRWNGEAWLFELALAADYSAAGVKEMLRTYRKTPGKFRAFIERVWTPDASADWRSDNRHGYARVRI